VLRQQVALSLVNRALRLGALQRLDEELSVYEEVERRFGSANEWIVSQMVATALVNKAMRLGALERYDDELAGYVEVAARYGGASETALQQQVAKALVCRGLRLERLQCSEEAMAVFAEVERRFGESIDPILRQLVGTARAVTRLRTVSPDLAIGTEEQENVAQSGSKIRCPLCGWQPVPGSVWTCSCGNTWDTFQTGGICPACLKQWDTTDCLGCSRTSPHSDWYHY
jgi:citrate lyase gamma subunit